MNQFDLELKINLNDISQEESEIVENMKQGNLIINLFGRRFSVIEIDYSTGYNHFYDSYRIINSPSFDNPSMIIKAKRMYEFVNNIEDGA